MDELMMTGVSLVQVVILLLAVGILAGCDLYTHRKETLLPEVLIKTGEIKRNICLLVMAVVILVFGVYGDQEIRNFIYMDF